MAKTAYIYMILSEYKPFRCYIGSSIDIKDRWSAHRRGLIQNKHHSRKLQRHYNKYGINDLVFIILEEWVYNNEKEIIAKEQFYIDLLKPYFNMCPIAGSVKNRKLTKAQRAKLNKKPVSKETREKQRNAKLGKKRNPHSPETIEKIRRGNQGKKNTQAQIDATILRHTGIPLSEEHCMNISKSLKGKKHKIESTAKTIATKKGLEHTKENIDNIINDLIAKRNKKQNKRSADEVNEGISRSLKEYFKNNPQAKYHLSEIQKGKKQSDSTIENMKIGQKKRRDRERVDRENGVI